MFSVSRSEVHRCPFSFLSCHLTAEATLFKNLMYLSKEQRIEISPAWKPL